MRRPGWILIALIISCVVAVEAVQACTCSAPANTAEGLTRSAAVFTGRVTEISRPWLDRIGLTQSDSYRVEFVILKQWKGTPATSTVVTTRLTGEACGFPFEINKVYLVYVVTEPKDIQTGICTGTKNIAAAKQEMKQLDQLREGGSP